MKKIENANNFISSNKLNLNIKNRVSKAVVLIDFIILFLFFFFFFFFARGTLFSKLHNAVVNKYFTVEVLGPNEHKILKVKFHSETFITIEKKIDINEKKSY